ncbi:complex I intermediate-associated protein 30, mitochondrial [Chelonus insularis]|uniref:complex I intermediate-associated protein 30, mitochondrial n=1 Tax=Chelonus insularis TaxID=460826 RepID=UPI00158D74B4|nr:complex I intermediate-associated protein 30, mitochondrial [Chelonus insularis]
MSSRLIKLLKFSKIYHCRTISTTSHTCNFYEPRKPAAYRKTDGKEEIKYSDDPLTELKERLQFVIDEFKLMGQEIKTKLTQDPIWRLPHDEVDIQWQFKGDPARINDWVVSMDSDFGFGRSYATLEMTPEGHGIFHGNIDTRPIQDGVIKRTGYCNLRSVRRRAAFHRTIPLGWDAYTHIVLRVRGDGRNYMINLHPTNEFDISWHDLWSYVLHTRGGPYWQYVKIPFSKFFFSSKGRIQDKQAGVLMYKLTFISITAVEPAGPFKLEIDFVGVERDDRFQEHSAYELYISPFPFYT